MVDIINGYLKDVIKQDNILKSEYEVDKVRMLSKILNVLEINGVKYDESIIENVFSICKTINNPNIEHLVYQTIKLYYSDKFLKNIVNISLCDTSDINLFKQLKNIEFIYQPVVILYTVLQGYVNDEFDAMYVSDLKARCYNLSFYGDDSTEYSIDEMSDFIIDNYTLYFNPDIIDTENIENVIQWNSFESLNQIDILRYLYMFTTNYITCGNITKNIFNQENTSRFTFDLIFKHLSSTCRNIKPIIEDLIFATLNCYTSVDDMFNILVSLSLDTFYISNEDGIIDNPTIEDLYNDIGFTCHNFKDTVCYFLRNNVYLLSVLPCTYELNNVIDECNNFGNDSIKTERLITALSRLLYLYAYHNIDYSIAIETYLFDNVADDIRSILMNNFDKLRYNSPIAPNETFSYDYIFNNVFSDCPYYLDNYPIVKELLKYSKKNDNADKFIKETAHSIPWIKPITNKLESLQKSKYSEDIISIISMELSLHDIRYISSKTIDTIELMIDYFCTLLEYVNVEDMEMILYDDNIVSCLSKYRIIMNYYKNYIPIDLKQFKIFDSYSIVLNI